MCVYVCLRACVHVRVSMYVCACAGFYFHPPGGVHEGVGRAKFTPLNDGCVVSISPPKSSLGGERFTPPTLTLWGAASPPNFEVGGCATLTLGVHDAYTTGNRDFIHRES